MKTYFFYDIETTGLNKAFDQILHFAAIRTDFNFNEISRHDLKVKLNPDVIPSPEAMLTHCMRLKDISDGVSEYDAIKQIHQWMNEPGTISLGYNTLGFDDEFLRYSFFRHLFSPYTHQYANGCGRMDIYPIVTMYYLFKNSALLWPIEGQQGSLKLEDLNKINKFVSGSSHDAMVDVEVSLMIVKKLIKERSMWNYVCGYFNKSIDKERIKKTNVDNALMIWGKFGLKQLFQSQVLYLGERANYNQILFLRLDDKDFSSATRENIIELAYVVSKKLGEPGFLLPCIERSTHHLDIERLELANSNKRWLRENPEFFKYISEYHCNYKHPEISGVDVDASLYLNGFWTLEETNFCREFHIADPTGKSKMIGNVHNPRLSSLAIRILGRHFPDFLSAEQSEYFSRYISEVNSDSTSIIDYKGSPRLAPNVALQKISEIRNKNLIDDKKLALLNDLEIYLRDRQISA